MNLISKYDKFLKEGNFMEDDSPKDAKKMSLDELTDYIIQEIDDEQLIIKQILKPAGLSKDEIKEYTRENNLDAPDILEYAIETLYKKNKGKVQKIVQNWQKQFESEELNEDKKEMKRYTVTLDFYMWAKDDNDIKKKADKYVEKMNSKDDSQATVLEIHATPMGSMSARKVK